MRIFVDASLIVYLNVRLAEEPSRMIEEFYRRILEEELYTDVLALDEAIYISRTKYGVAVEDTLELIDKAVLPYTEIVPLGGAEYARAKAHMLKYNLTPSDALHLAAMDNNGI